MTAAPLGIASAFLWGTSGFAGGLASGRIGALRSAAGSQLAGLVVLAVVIAASGTGPPPPASLLPATLGGLAGALGLVCLFRALARGPMSVVAPVAACGGALPLVTGLAGGERLTAVQALGIGLAIGGIVLVTRRGARQRKAAPPGLALAICAAALFGCFYLGLRSHGTHAVLWTVAAARTSSVALLLPLAARRGLRATGRAGTATAISGVLDVSANGLYSFATAMAPAGIVSVLAATYPVATLAWARLALRERLERSQGLGALAAVCAVVLMATR